MLIGKLASLPMPPTINQSYAQAGRRRVASSALKQFKAELASWGLLHRFELSRLRSAIEKTESSKVRLEFRFKFNRGQLYTKQGKNKKLDCSNRIKAAEDGVCKLLGFDDRDVFRVEAEKVTADAEPCFDLFVYDWGWNEN